MSRRRTVPVGAASLLALSVFTGCAVAPPAEPPAGVAGDWSFDSVEDGARSLARAERELDLLLAAELDIAEETGSSPEEAAQWLPRPGSGAMPAAGPATDDTSFVAAASFTEGGSNLAVLADYPIPQPDLETVGAAANSLSLLHDVLRNALGNASLDSSTHSSEHSMADGQNPRIRWSVQKGWASGAFTSSISDTNDAGDSVTVALEGAFEMGVCPDSDGAAEGAFFTTAAVTFTPHDGTPRRTAIDIDMKTVIHVTDEAYTAELWARVDSAVRTGAPEVESDTRVAAPADVREESNAYAFEFGETGVQDHGTLTADEQLDGAFSAQVDDLAEQIALLVARAAEDFWRDGNCIDIMVEAEDITPRPGEKQQLWVDAISVVDGEKITHGTVEFTGVLGDSTVNPTGRQKIEDADYQFIAGQQYGKADPDFEVVSRRGIGRGGPGITVSGDVWTLTGAADSAEYSGLSCTGI